MKQFQDKKQVKSRLYSRLTVIGLVILVILLANGVWNIYLRERASERIRRESESRLAALASQKANLEKEIDKMKDDAGIEEEIRAKFNVIKPGENVVMIVNPEDATNTAATSTGFWGSLWQRLGF